MKRGDVYWTYFYVDAVRHQESTGTSNRRRALQIEAKLIEEANFKRFQMNDYRPDMKFDELAAYFLTNGTVRRHHKDRLKMLLPYFGEMAIISIDKGVVNKYRQARHEQKQVTEATVNRDIEVLRHILYWAVDDAHYLAANPLARIRLERERKKKRPVLSVAGEVKLIGAASKHLKRIIIVALDTGMRRGELLGQIWQDIDFERRVLSVTRSKTPEGEAREICLTERVMRVLAKLPRDSERVFTFQDEPIAAIKTSWKTALSRAGIGHIRFHDLRHTFATRLMEAGVVREVRKALMGHSSGEDVHDGYVHVELYLKREAVAMLERWHKKQNKKGGGSNDSAKVSRVEAVRAAERRPEGMAKENAS